MQAGEAEVSSASLLLDIGASKHICWIVVVEVWRRGGGVGVTPMMLRSW